MGKQWKQWQTLFSWAPKSLQIVTDGSREIKRHLLPGRKAMTNLDSILKSTDITLPTKVCLLMYGCESWTVRRLCAKELTLLNCGVGEDSWESLGLQGYKPVNPKGNQSWIFIGRTNAEAEVDAPILWPPDVNSQLIWKDPDAGTDWRQEEKGTTENEMVVWHHWFNGHEFEQALRDGEWQGSQACCSPWSRKVRHN